MKIAVVIPAHNEAKSLPKILKQLSTIETYHLKVFVIDDGSEDNTSFYANMNGAEVVRHSIPLGVGGALKTGYFLASDWGAKIIVQIDADGEHDPAELPRFIEILLNGEADMVIGSRFINGPPDLSLARKVGIRFFTWLVNLLSGYKLTDVTSGYRAFNANCMHKIFFPSDKHWAIEMTLLAGKHSVRVVEIPILSMARESGRSQFHELMTFVLYPLRAIKQIIDVYM